MRSESRRSWGSLPASARRMPTASLAMVSQSTKNSMASWVQEDEAGRVERAGRVGEQLGVERLTETVGGEDVEPGAANKGRCVDHGVEDPLHIGPTRSCAGRRCLGAAVLAVRTRWNRCALSASSSWSARCQAVENALGHAAGLAALETRVVLDGRSRRAGRPPRCRSPYTRRLLTVGRQPGLLRSDPSPASTSGTRGSRCSRPRLQATGSRARWEALAVPPTNRVSPRSLARWFPLTST